MADPPEVRVGFPGVRPNRRGGSISAITNWLHFADHTVAPFRRSASGSISVITQWLHSSDQQHRRRALYTVRCRALLVDLRGKRAECPFLTAEDHARTREIGRRLHREGHPGLAAPSARHAAGENLAVFTPAVLSQAALQARLTYAMDPQALTVTVKDDAGGTLRVIDGKAGWPAP